jgi:hypothetical protein
MKRMRATPNVQLPTPNETGHGVTKSQRSLQTLFSVSPCLRGPCRVAFVFGIWVLGVGSSLEAQRGGGAAATARAAAPVDLTGTWVALVTEDWRWRMITPTKGDYSTVQAVMTPEARKVADAWDPARDTAAGEQCRAYGGGAIMRVPGRIRVSWENDTTLKVETEAGTQTRRFEFSAPAAAAAPSWQGTSAATWLTAGGGGRRGGGAAGPRAGSLRVVTTNLRPGYLRKNGVPYGANARVTEHFNRLDEPNGDAYLVVTTLIEDPQYLTTRYQVSSHFKKVNDAAWNPTPCSAT